MSAVKCLGCDAEVPPSKNPGIPRKWCSDRCRKRTYDREQYKGTCETCGAETGKRHTTRCLKCETKRRGAEQADRVALTARLYNSGKSYAEIRAALGYAPGSEPGRLLALARERGLIRFRYAACEGRAA